MNDTKNAMTPRAIIQMLIFIIVMPLLPLLISFRWNWWEAWAFALISILGFFISRALAARQHPDLIAERSKTLDHEDAKAWDKVLAPLVSLGGILPLLAAGVEARFDAPDDFSLAVKLVALFAVAASYALGGWALITNRYFSGIVRIQKDRGHQVVSSGPYRWLRHPGYAATLITYLALPFLLDSLWALVPSVLLVVALVLRTSLEDRTLQAELPGYRDYASHVRYRLLPGVW